MEYMAQSPIGNVLYKRRRDKMLCVRIDVHPCIPWKTPAKVKPDVMHACIYNTGKGPKKKKCEYMETMQTIGAVKFKSNTCCSLRRHRPSSQSARVSRFEETMTEAGEFDSTDYPKQRQLPAKRVEVRQGGTSDLLPCPV